MNPLLETDDLVRLVRRVFQPGAGDRGLALLVDLPDERLPDNEAWKARRLMAADWHRRLADGVGVGCTVRHSRGATNPPAGLTTCSAGSVRKSAPFFGSSHSIFLMTSGDRDSQRLPSFLRRLAKRPSC